MKSYERYLKITDQFRFSDKNIQSYQSIPYVCKFSHSYSNPSPSGFPYAVGEENGNINIISDHPCCWKNSNNAVTSLAWSFNDQILAAGSADHSVKLWNLARMLSSEIPLNHSSSVISLDFSLTSPFVLLSGEKEGKLYAKDIRDGSSHCSISIKRAANRRKSLGLSQQLNCASFIPYSHNVATLFHDKFVLYDIRKASSPLKEFSAPTPKGFVHFTMDYNGNSFFIMGKDSNIYSYNSFDDSFVTKYECNAQVSSFFSQLKYFQFGKEEFIISSSANNSILLWNLSSAKAYKLSDVFYMESTCLDCSYNGSDIIICSDEKKSVTFNVSNWNENLAPAHFVEHSIDLIRADYYFNGQENCLNYNPSKKSKRQSLLSNFFSIDAS